MRVQPGTDQGKKCWKCGQLKSFSEFHRATGMKDGHRGECKECSRAERRLWYQRNRAKAIAKAQQWREDNPERYQAWLKQNRTINKERRRETDRRGHLRRKYGLAIEVYEFLCVAQSGRCAICSEPAEKLHVDHEHETGLVRGLLCGKCNKAIGLLNDDPGLLRSAASYLAKPQLPLGCGDSAPVKRRGRTPSARDGIS